MVCFLISIQDRQLSVDATVQRIVVARPTSDCTQGMYVLPLYGSLQSRYTPAL